MLFPILILEDFVQRNVEDACDPEGQSERRHILSLFKGDDCLPGTFSPISKFLLCHFAVFKAEFSYVVFYLSFRHGRSSLRKEPE